MYIKLKVIWFWKVEILILKVLLNILFDVLKLIFFNWNWLYFDEIFILLILDIIIEEIVFLGFFNIMFIVLEKNKIWW